MYTYAPEEWDPFNGWPFCMWTCSNGEFGTERVDRRLPRSGSTSDREPFRFFFFPIKALLKELLNYIHIKKKEKITVKTVHSYNQNGYEIFFNGSFMVNSVSMNLLPSKKYIKIPIWRKPLVLQCSALSKSSLKFSNGLFQKWSLTRLDEENDMIIFWPDE